MGYDPFHTMLGGGFLKKHLEQKNMVPEPLVEAKLSRIFQYVEDPKKTFGIVSASRSELPDAENNQRYVELKKKVREMGLGFIEMKGGWTEGGITSEELSLFIPKISREQILALGKHYGQYSVMHKDEREFVYIGTNENAGVGKILSRFKAKEGKDNIDLTKERVKDYFSMLRKGSHRNKKFVFNPKAGPDEKTRESESKVKKPGSVWKTEGGLWGAKNRAGELDYFDDPHKAEGFAKSMREEFQIFEKEEWNFAKAAYIRRGFDPAWIRID